LSLSAESGKRRAGRSLRLHGTLLASHVADGRPVPGSRLAQWKEQFSFLESAEREFRSLSIEIQDSFLNVFPEFARHPTRATLTLDVRPLRDRAGRWRLKVPGGHRGVFRIVQGRPEFEMFETRDEVYERLRRYLIWRTK
jgi:hypothetical protein